MTGIREGLIERRLERPDARTVAWTEWGRPDGTPLVRMPGTPGSRLMTRADKSPWIERDLRVITTERPGFGASTRLPGRGFREHADDVAAILDAVGLERVFMEAGSGGAPHLLAFLQHHPERVLAATVVVGAAPLEDAEVDGLIPMNAELHRLAAAGDIAAIQTRASQLRDVLLADPIAGFRGIMATAPPADRDLMMDPGWQEALSVQLREALRPGIDGWVDEDLVLERPWSDIEPDAIEPSLTWWHSDADRNVPISAARRLVDRLPKGELRVWRNAGHLESYRRASEILDDLLQRGWSMLTHHASDIRRH